MAAEIQFTLKQVYGFILLGYNRGEIAHFLNVNERSITIKVRRAGYKSLLHFAASYGG